MIPNNLTITRIHNRVARIRSFQVYLDGNFLGEIKDQETQKYNIMPGKHQLQLKVDWCQSNIYGFDIKLDQKLALTCGTNPTSGIANLVYVILKPGKYLFIGQKPDR